MSAHSHATAAATATLQTRGLLAPPLPIRVRVATRPAAASSPSSSPHLVGSSPPPPPSPMRSSSIRLVGGIATIGAASGCDLVIDDAGVSRRHVEIELVPEGVLVRDLESRNGTYYLGQRVERMIVSPPAMLQIGSTTIAIELDPEATAQSEPLRLAGFRGMIGTSSVMQRLFGSIARLDGSLVPTLLLGETGVGKELLARAIHEGSRVGEGPFVAVNCGALARELVGSTLFGHRRGAFTGATDTRRGAFGAAQGGTLFLDEIGELPLEMQPALLRALETGEITAIGDDTPQRVNVRLLAATNRDLAAEVRAGRFREDLYFRLAVVTLRIPALRERPDDIGPLADLFARQEGYPGLPHDVREQLMRRPFPGNVRELRNAVRSFVALGTLDDHGSVPPSSGIQPTISSIPGSFAPAPLPRDQASSAASALDEVLAAMMRFDVPYLQQRDAIVERFTHLYVDRLLRETGGNQTAAAKVAGLDRTYFGRLLAKIGRR